MRSPASVALLLSLLTASCGGNVVVDSGSTSTVTTGTAGLCLAACQAVVAACPGKGPAQGCTVSCQNLDPAFTAACPAEYDAYLACIESNPTDLCGTGTGMACLAQITAFQPCNTQVCSSNPTACQ